MGVEREGGRRGGQEEQSKGGLRAGATQVCGAQQHVRGPARGTPRAELAPASCCTCRAAASSCKTAARRRRQWPRRAAARE
eukprot:2284008-Pleurochrysis_carterae.AAC.3